MKILVAEDDPLSCRVLQATLVKWGHDVVVSRDGDEAMAVLQRADAPPLAILDWMMPGCDGIEVCRQVRQSPNAAPTYIILLTAKGEKEDIVTGLEAGADDYLIKPFVRAELQARIGVGERVIALQQRLADRVSELDRALAERELVLEALRASESRYRDLVENSQGLICTQDLAGTLLSVNAAAAHLLEYLPQEMVGRNMREFVAPAQRHLFDLYLERIRQQATDNGLVKVVSRSGVEFIWQYHNSRQEAPGKEAYILGHAQDVTEMKLDEARLRNLSLTDDLTGLNNQRGFIALAKQHLKAARREGQSFSIIYADMDGLKQINDTYGHPVGSQAIKRIAGIMRNSFRASDVIARLGGDEFAILVANTSAENIGIPLSHLRDHLRRYNAKGFHPYELSLSVGTVCVQPDSDSSLEDLMARADQAMYENKKHKKQSPPLPGPLPESSGKAPRGEWVS